MSKRTLTPASKRDPETGLAVGFIPGLPGAHSRGETLGELQCSLHEVAAMLLADGEPRVEAEFAGGAADSPRGLSQMRSQWSRSHK